MKMVTKNNKPSRFIRLVLYPMVGLFFVTLLTFVLLMANGYKFFIDKGKIGFQKTGMIIVTSRPINTEIYLDDKYTGKKITIPFLSVKVAKIKPGRHKLSIKKVGYQVWEKSFEVKENLVSWADYVLLFPKEIKSEKSKILVDQTLLSNSKNNHQALYVGKNKNNENELYLFDITTNNQNKVWPPDNKSLAEAWLQNIQIISTDVSNSSQALLVVKKNQSKELVIMDFSKAETSISHRLDLTDTEVSKIVWNPKNKNEIILFGGKKISRIVLEGSGQIKKNIAIDEILDFSIDTVGTIFYVQSTKLGTMVGKIQPDASGKEIITNSIKTSSSYKFAYSRQRDSLAVLSVETKDLKIFDKTNERKDSIDFSNNIIDMEWSKNGNRLVYFDNKQIKVYDFEKKEEKKISPTGKIIGVKWYFDENHLLINTDIGLYVSDYDGENQVSLAEKVNRNFIYDQSSIFYSKLEAEKENFYNIKLNF